MAIPGWQPLVNICDPLAPLGQAGRCDFAAFVTLIKHGITDLVILSSLLLVIILLTAGFKLITSQGNPGALTKAKEMFWNVVIGYAIIILAWTAIYSITSVLLSDKFNFFLKG